jgi:hypothetical protein
VNIFAGTRFPVGQSVRVLDGRWGTCGHQLILSDEKGSFLLFDSADGKSKLDISPLEQYFLHDYHKTNLDMAGRAIDIETNVMAHMMPRAPLCNAAGEEYDKQPIPLGAVLSAQERKIWLDALKVLHYTIHNQSYRDTDILFHVIGAS